MPVDGNSEPAAAGNGAAGASNNAIAGGDGTARQSSGFGDLFDSSALGRNLLMDMDTEAIPGQSKRPRDDDADAEETRTPLRPQPSEVQDTTEYVKKIQEMESYGITLTKKQKETLLQSTGYLRPTMLGVRPHTSTLSTPASSTSQIANLGVVQTGVNQQMNRRTNSISQNAGPGGGCPNQQNQSSKGRARPKSQNWSFKVKSEQRIDELKLLETLGTTLPPDSKILSSRMTQSGILLVKTSVVNNNHGGALNHFLQPRVKTLVENKYGKGSLEFLHFDPTSGKSDNDARLTKQAIARGVPLSATTDWILAKIKGKGGDFATKIQGVHRITSQQTSKPTGLIRIICTDTDMASGLVKDGISICGLFFRCEPPNSRPEPRQCFQCQGFNHLSYACQEPQKCGKCGGAHRMSACGVLEADFICPNCGQNHGSWSRSCSARAKATTDMAAKEAAKKAAAPSAQPATAGAVGKVQQATAQTNKNIQDTSQKVGEVKQLLEVEVAKLRLEMSSELDKVRNDVRNELELFKNDLSDTIRTTIRDSLNKAGMSPSNQLDQKGLQKQIKSHQDALQKQFTQCMARELADMSANISLRLENIGNIVQKERQNMFNHIDEHTGRWQDTVIDKQNQWDERSEKMEERFSKLEEDIRKGQEEQATWTQPIHPRPEREKGCDSSNDRERGRGHGESRANTRSSSANNSVHLTQFKEPNYRESSKIRASHERRDQRKHNPLAPLTKTSTVPSLNQISGHE